MKQLSRAVVFVDTNAKKDRIAVLKGHGAIDQLDGEDTDVFQKSLIDRYRYRPEQLQNMCLAEFAALYSTCYNNKDDEMYNDELSDTDSEGSTKKIKSTKVLMPRWGQEPRAHAQLDALPYCMNACK